MHDGMDTTWDSKQWNVHGKNAPGVVVVETHSAKKISFVSSECST